MQFSPALLAAVLAAYFAMPFPVSAAGPGVTGFSDVNCNTNHGANVECDGQCVNFAGRKALMVNSTVLGRCVSIYTINECGGPNNGSSVVSDLLDLSTCHDIAEIAPSVGSSDSLWVICSKDQTCAK